MSFASIRTGKASPALVENLDDEAYGSSMKLKQVALITTPEAAPHRHPAVRRLDHARHRARDQRVPPRHRARRRWQDHPHPDSRALPRNAAADLVKTIKQISENRRSACALPPRCDGFREKDAEGRRHHRGRPPRRRGRHPEAPPTPTSRRSRQHVSAKEAEIMKV